MFVNKEPSIHMQQYSFYIQNIPYETKWVNFDDIKTVIPAIT